MVAHAPRRLRRGGSAAASLVAPVNLGDAVLSASAPVRILAALQETGLGMSPAQIIEATELNPNTVRVNLKRMAERGKVIRLDDGSYGLLTSAPGRGEA